VDHSFDRPLAERRKFWAKQTRLHTHIYIDSHSFTNTRTHTHSQSQQSTHTYTQTHPHIQRNDRQRPSKGMSLIQMPCDEKAVFLARNSLPLTHTDKQTHTHTDNTFPIPHTKSDIFFTHTVTRTHTLLHLTHDTGSKTFECIHRHSKGLSLIARPWTENRFFVRIHSHTHTHTHR